MAPIILASTSPYRKKQLKQFGYRFRALAPRVDEEALKSGRRSPRALSRFLAQKKAESLVTLYPEAIIIGGDQLIEWKGRILGKPHTTLRAERMLWQMRNSTHKLITSICVIYKKKKILHTVTAQITMRAYSRHEVRQYVQLDKPLQSAGSYKFESAGLRLVKKMRVNDPSSLIGLPLIGLQEALLQITKD